MRIAQSVDAEQLVTTANGSFVSVTPPDPESQVELARAARSYAFTAATVALDRLTLSTCSSTLLGNPAATGMQPAAQILQGQHLASFVREAEQFIVESTDFMASRAAAVSDAQAARATDRAEAEVVELAAFASRAAAAHTVLGGEHGLNALRTVGGPTGQGFFPQGPLSAAGARALEQFRAAAVSPDRIANLTGPTALDIDAIVYGSGANHCHSVRARVGIMSGRMDMLEASSPAAYYELVGIPRDAFVEARAHLFHQQRAFDRSTFFQLPVESLADGQGSDDVTFPPGDYSGAGEGCSFDLYAATRNPPRQPPDLFWTALLRYDSTPTPLVTLALPGTGTGPAWFWGVSPTTPHAFLSPPGSTYGTEALVAGGGVMPAAVAATQPSTNGFTQLAMLMSIAERSQRAIDRLTPMSGAGPAAARETLAAVLGDVGRGTLGDTGTLGIAGRGRACVIGKDPSTATIRLDVDVQGLSPTDLVVVTRHESLDCATYGSIERAACAPSDIQAITAATWSSSSVGPGVLTASFDVPLADWGVVRPAEGVQTVYVLRRRPEMVGDQPGGFIEVVGWALPRPAPPTGTTYVYCDSVPISPGIFHWGAEQVMPSESYTSAQASVCAGLNVDDFRLPLENELTDDLDGRESSWAHYLRLAQSSADLAENLGETLLDEGLQMDLRAEAAVDALEQICGVRIDVSPTERIASTMPVMSGVCPEGYFRQDPAATTCTLDAVAWAIANAARDSDAAALARCLGTTSEDSLESSFVGVGDTPLCLWRLTSDESTICQQEEGGPHRPCPFLAAEGPAPCASADMPPGATAIYVPSDRLLNLFHVPPDPVPVPPSPSDLPCAALAQLRADREQLTLEQAYRFVGSSFLTRETFRNFARNLRWEATAGDFSRVYSGNALIASTGSPSLSEGRWPVGDAPFEWLCPESTPPGFVRPSLSTPGGALTVIRNYHGPLFCIREQGTNMASNGPDAYASGSNRTFRAAINDLLARAVLAAHVVSGESLTGSRFPYLPPEINCGGPGAVDSSTVEGTVYSQVGPGESLVFQLEDGTLRLDHTTDESGGDPYGFTDEGLTAQYVVSAHEWRRQPYDRVGGFTYDFDETRSPLYGTPGDTNLPFFVLSLGDEDLDGVEVDISAARLWGDIPPAGASGRGSARLSSFMGRQLSFLFSGVTPPNAPGDVLSSFATGGAPVLLTDLTRYYPAPTYAGCWQRSGIQTLHQNILRPADEGFTSNDVLNGLELTCMAAQRAAPDPIAYGCDTNIVVNDIRDAVESREALRCLAARVSDSASRSVIRGLPPGIAVDVRSAGGSALGSGSGDYGAQVAIIRAALLEVQGEEESIATAIRAYANSLETVRNAIRAHRIGSEIEELELQATVANQVTNCVVAASSIAEATGVDSVTSGALGAAMMRTTATCSNGIFQSAIATRVADLRVEAGGIEIETALLGADTQFVQTSQAIRDHAVSIRAAFARIDAAVTQLRSLQGQGRTALARALFLDDTPTGTHLAVDTVMHRRFNRTRVRYQEAQQRAVRTAYIARRALEQRLGMDLSTIDTDLVTVDAPSGWVDELCTLPALDYERLRDSGDPELASPENYIGYSIGDYVRRLEQVFESYSFAYPFQDGTDRVVLSLRDDIHRVTNECRGPVPNLLLQTRNLQIRRTDSRPGWIPANCGTSGPCVTTSPSGISLPETLGPEVSEGVLVQFGAGATADTRYAQTVGLERGRYRLSWWATNGVGSSTAEQLSGSEALRALDSSGLPFTVLNAGGPAASAMIDGWTRHDYFFDVPSADQVTIAVRTDPSTPVFRSIVVAGVQLERATGLFERDVNAPYYSGISSVPIAMEFPPGQFYPTDDTRIGTIPGCADDGTNLRAGNFVHRCEMRCTDGRGSCAVSEMSPLCWFETSFSIDEASLSTVVSGTPAGFARGNYNYRIESVGLNFVGTGLRQCASGGTSGCYGAGNLAYTLVHQGDLEGNFAVRNALDQSYPAPLFPGRIEGARALAAERYLSNPTSGADDALIGPYLRGEFQGRPLAGTMTLRIWDEPTLAWQNLEDIQIVLNYRYWTPQR
jgi:hypothetical protein